MSTIQFINPPGLFKGSFSHVAAVHAGTTVYISGQVAFDEDGNVSGKTFEEQCVKVFENLQLALSGANADFRHLVKMNIYVRDLTHQKLQCLRSVRANCLGSHQPASTLVATPGLVHEDLMLEVEAVAVIPQPDA
jgi:enamine deaminase RidA (YjgF/YER057c/UK114 family)